MKMKLTLLLAVLLIFGAGITVSAQDNNEKKVDHITIISGFKGGSYYQMATDIQKMTRKELGTPVMTEETKMVYQIENGDTVRDEDGEPITEEVSVKKPTGDTIDFVKVRDSDGAYYNFIQINKSNVDIAFMQYDVLLYEDLKDLKRKFKKTDKIRILLPIGKEEIHLITNKDSGIEEFKDLKKKRVGIGSALQGTNITAKFIKEKTKMKWEDVELPYDKAFRAMFNGDIDAFFFVGKTPISDLANLPKSMKDKIRLISLPVNEELKEAYGEQVDINNTTYSWVEKPVKTYAVQSLLVTSLQDQTPEKAEAIKKVLEIVKANKDKAGYFEGWKEVNFQENPDIEWEYHPIMKELF